MFLFIFVDQFHQFFFIFVAIYLLFLPIHFLILLQFVLVFKQSINNWCLSNFNVGIPQMQFIRILRPKANINDFGDRHFHKGLHHLQQDMFLCAILIIEGHWGLKGCFVGPPTCYQVWFKGIFVFLYFPYIVHHVCEFHLLFFLNFLFFFFCFSLLFFCIFLFLNFFYFFFYQLFLLFHTIHYYLYLFYFSYSFFLSNK